MKSYTDIEQSRKLAEILPLESADMFHFLHEVDTVGFGYKKDVEELYSKTKFEYIPCWSLAALLGILPKGTNISTHKSINALCYCCWNRYDEIYADNPIDACYTMILKLHELKML